MPFAATWMDLEITTVSEINQTENGKHLMIPLICGIFKEKKKDTNEHIYKPETDSKTLKTVTKGDRYSGGGMDWGFEI